MSYSDPERPFDPVRSGKDIFEVAARVIINRGAPVLFSFTIKV